MPTARCQDCQHVYILLRQPRKNALPVCKPCRLKRHAAQKLASQRRLQGVTRPIERDLTEAEVEIVFQQALKEARRQSSGSLEPFRSYEFLYREPRG